MFKIKIISVGSKPDKNLKELIDSYSKKISNQFDVDWINIKAEKKFDSTSQKKEYEAKKITAYIENSFVVAMDENGQQFNSKEFTNKMTGWIRNYPCITFIIGGAEIYTQGLIKAHRIYLTEVEASVDGDTYFPDLSTDDWVEIEDSGLFAADDRHTYPYRFRTLERRKVSK